jgi:hypothetical protein
MVEYGYGNRKGTVRVLEYGYLGVYYYYLLLLPEQHRQQLLYFFNLVSSLILDERRYCRLCSNEGICNGYLLDVPWCILCKWRGADNLTNGSKYDKIIFLAILIEFNAFNDLYYEILNSTEYCVPFNHKFI